MPFSRKILLVEDETVFRNLLAGHLGRLYADYQILEASDGVEGWSLYRKHEPAFCILDLHLPQMNGFSLLNLIASHHHDSRILILTGRTQLDRIPRLPGNLENLFWVEKGTSLDSLNDALCVLLGRARTRERFFRVQSGPENAENVRKITKREKTVLSMIGSGMSIREIARILGISLMTAQTHRRNLMQKLDLHSSTMLTKYALENGFTIISPENVHEEEVGTGRFNSVRAKNARSRTNRPVDKDHG